MVFNKLSWWPISLASLLILIYVLYRYRQNFFYFTNRYFFKNATKASKVSFFFLILSLLSLGAASLDLRGKPERVESSIPDQKTIIIIDASASMLVEDVRPNRFQKSLLIARHFIKNAVGHQISLVLFSDTQRKLVPFTDDIDLLDAKVAGLEGMDISSGGSNISMAINESLQYFKEESGSSDITQGNILVFTDSEENEDEAAIKIPDSVNIAFVGVGTLGGGPIPLRGQYGGFRGYKSFNGERVISKLNENYLRSLEGKIKNFKYWIVQSYNIPTDEILSFFKAKFQMSLAKGSSIVQPVEIKYTLIPFYLFLLFSVLFKQGRSLKHLVLVFAIVSMGVREVPAQEVAESKEVVALKEKIANDDENESLYMELASQYLRENNADKADVIYKERIDDQSKFGANDLINYGTAQLLQGRFAEALDTFKYVEKNKVMNDEQKNVVKNNIVNAQTEIDKKKKQEKEEKEKKEKEEKEKKEQEEKKEEQKEDQGEEKKENQKEQQDQDGKGQKDSKNNKDQKKPNKNNSDQDSEENKKEKKKEDKKEEKKEEKEGQDNKPEQKPQSLEEKENDIKKKRKMVKIPAALQQILDDDKNLQKKILERVRSSKSSDRGRKDW